MVQELFEKAVKVDGIVDIMVPDYHIQIAIEQYFLWLNEDDTITIMNKNDTNTRYKISDDKEVKAFVFLISGASS
ncbi:hypothetical protein [Solibacillus sp. FSL H8-0538]|uniref:hypothetical protein n=1 Tax=Solibacillus sp. FSL H8-0538 TaxID=2921400 RepID=UPI0030FC705D